MQRLNPGMMERYEIEAHIPEGVNAVQFGTGEALLGVADRLLDGLGVGVACVTPEGPWTGDGADPGELLREQSGLYTVLIRGYRGDAPVKREVVVQTLLRVVRDGEALEALAREPGLAMALIDAGDEALEPLLRQAARLLQARFRAGLDGLDFVCLGDDAGCAEKLKAAVAELDGSGEDFLRWLDGRCAFLPALAEGFAYRADAHEAAKQCAEMNYADGMLHLAEPFARLTVAAPGGLRLGKALEGAEGIRIVDDLSPALEQKRGLFDAGLFLLAAPGWLLGLNTLADCMKHEKLRAFAGHAWMEELLPQQPEARAAATAAVEECFERFENPLTDNRLLPASRPLLRRFALGALPRIRAWADENFEPPRRLSFALAATIMLYAGARPNPQGQYEVARGQQSEVLRDDPEALALFATLSHDMSPEALAYAVLADRELWGTDLREIDGLEQRVTLDLARLQREPNWLPE